MAEEIGLFEAMNTQRALRYIAPDPVPDALIRKVLEAGTRAPSGGNQQRWRFIVIKDPRAPAEPGRDRDDGAKRRRGQPPGGPPP